MSTKIDDGDKYLIEMYKDEIEDLLNHIETDYHLSYRELSIVKTKLEECEMWLDKLIKSGDEE